MLCRACSQGVSSFDRKKWPESDTNAVMTTSGGQLTLA